MKKLYKKLTKDQKERGVIFSSCLSTHSTELEDDTIHEVMKEDRGKILTIKRLKDDKFFRDSHFKFNIIRS